MKLSEYKGEEALEVLADLLEPALDIFTDKEFLGIIKNGEKKTKAITYAIKEHKTSVLEILAATEGMPVSEYRDKCNVMTLPAKLLEILNDKELMNFFYSQLPKEVQTYFGSAMENTEEKEQ